MTLPRIGKSTVHKSLCLASIHPTYEIDIESFTRNHSAGTEKWNAFLGSRSRARSREVLADLGGHADLGVTPANTLPTNARTQRRAYVISVLLKDSD